MWYSMAQGSQCSLQCGTVWHRVVRVHCSVVRYGTGLSGFTAVWYGMAQGSHGSLQCGTVWHRVFRVHCSVCGTVWHRVVRVHFSVVRYGTG